MKLSELGSKMIHAVCEETPDKVAPTPSFQPLVATLQPLSYQSTPVQLGTGVEADLYDMLKKNTSLEPSSAIQKVLSLQSSLEKIILDPTTRLKAAFATAEAQGIKMTDVSHDLDRLSSLVTAESTKFQTSMQHEKEGIADDEQHASMLEQDLHRLRSQISDRKSKLDRAEIGFSSALSRRTNEVEQLKSQFSTIQ
jgi:hypothetical protein